MIQLIIILLVSYFRCTVLQGGGVITETKSNDHPRLDSNSESRFKFNLVSASDIKTVCPPLESHCSAAIPFHCSARGGDVSTGTNSTEHPRLDSASDSRFKINITKSNSLCKHNFICSSLVKPVSIINVCEPLKKHITVITTNDTHILHSPMTNNINNINRDNLATINSNCDYKPIRNNNIDNKCLVIDIIPPRNHVPASPISTSTNIPQICYLAPK